MFCFSGTKARLLLLPRSLLPWRLALHASSLLGCQLRPFSRCQVKSSVGLSADETGSKEGEKPTKTSDESLNMKRFVCWTHAAGNRCLLSRISLASAVDLPHHSVSPPPFQQSVPGTTLPPAGQRWKWHNCCKNTS